MRIRTGLIVVALLAWSVVGTFAQTTVSPATYVNGAGEVKGSVRFPASSYVNFGADAGTSGYGIRDNAGTVQFKNTGGAWTDISVAAGATYWTRTGSELFTGTDGDSLVLGSAVSRSKIVPLGAGIIALRDATVAQEFRVYTTYAGADADYEYASLKGAAGSITLSAATKGTGTDDVDVVIAPAGAGRVYSASPWLSRSKVTAVTTTAAPAAADANTVYVTGDADGSTATLPDDPAVTGLRFTFVVDTTQTSSTFTVAPNTGESLYFGGSTYATSCTSVQIGSALTILNTTTGSGAKWVIIAMTGTWSCS